MMNRGILDGKSAAGMGMGGLQHKIRIDEVVERLEENGE